MSDLDTSTLHAIAESAQSAATRASLGDKPGAEAALERATRHYVSLCASYPSHARIVRLAREALTRARTAVENMGGKATRREAGAYVRATARAVERAKA